jgi:hypothetical protein
MCNPPAIPQQIEFFNNKNGLCVMFWTTSLARLGKASVSKVLLDKESQKRSTRSSSGGQ